MRIVLLTQDEPFYLAPNLDTLLKGIPDHSQVVACVLFDASPFGGRSSFLSKLALTLHVFGVRFFLRYSLRFLLDRLTPGKRVRRVLRRHHVPILRLGQGVNHSDSLALIEGFRPDLLVSIAGNEIFKAPLIKLAPKGCLNVHTALLPDYRGLLPTFWAMKNEERQTGVSVFFVDRGIDSGPILLQQAVEIGDKTLEELIRCTKELGIKLTIEAVNRIHRGDCPLIRNDISKGRYYSFPTREDVKEFYARGKKFY